MKNQPKVLKDENGVITHRLRRGKFVLIPDEWRGKVTSHQTRNKRKDRRRANKLNRRKRSGRRPKHKR